MTTKESRIDLFEPPVGDGIGRLLGAGASDADLAEAMRSARAESGLRGLLVVIRGVDSGAASASQDFQAVCSDLASLPWTTVAVISGPALGKYLELALACDYRLAADEGVVLGLPEVAFGLIPGGGGTQRLPRLIGLMRALDLILRGRRLNANQARRVGLLDAVIPSGTLDEAAYAWARRPKRPRYVALRGGFMGLAERTRIGRRVIFDRARRAIPRGYPAPLKALDAIEIGLSHGIDAGLAAETKAVARLAPTQTTRNLTWLSIVERQQRARFHVDGGVHLAVIGGSAIGAAISEFVRGNQVALADADVVIVAARDELEHQRAAVRDAEARIRTDAVIGVHTASIPIREIASTALRPERIIGTRFITPVYRSRLLEVVQHERATEAAAATVAGLGTMLDKTVIVVSDGPGFFTSRALGVMLNEAALLVEEGASIEAIDGAMRRFGFPVGPLRLLDEVGLDVVQRLAEPLTLAFADRVPRSRVIADLVAQGCLGRSSSAGFYLWRGNSSLDRLLRRPRRVPNRAVYPGGPPRAIDDATAQARLALLFVNECIRCLEDGVLRSATDGDLGAVLALGFPPFLGGPFHYADFLGLRVLVDKLKSLADQHGSRFVPADLLLEHARDGRRFFEEPD